MGILASRKSAVFQDYSNQPYFKRAMPIKEAIEKCPEVRAAVEYAELFEGKKISPSILFRAVRWPRSFFGFKGGHFNNAKDYQLMGINNMIVLLGNTDQRITVHEAIHAIDLTKPNEEKWARSSVNGFSRSNDAISFLWRLRCEMRETFKAIAKHPKKFFIRRIYYEGRAKFVDSSFAGKGRINGIFTEAAKSLLAIGACIASFEIPLSNLWLGGTLMAIRAITTGYFMLSGTLPLVSFALYWPFHNTICSIAKMLAGDERPVGIDDKIAAFRITDSKKPGRFRDTLSPKFYQKEIDAAIAAKKTETKTA